MADRADSADDELQPHRQRSNVGLQQGRPRHCIRDRAPDNVASGFRWRFIYTAPSVPPPAPTQTPQPVVVKPVFGAATTVPPHPVAGKKLVFALTVNRSDTGAPLTTGTMTCDPSVAGKVLTHAESFRVI